MLPLKQNSVYLVRRVSLAMRHPFQVLENELTKSSCDRSSERQYCLCSV